MVHLRKDRLVAVAGITAVARAFDNTCNDNLAVYWGQNSYGAVNPSDPANWQQRLSYYCQDSTIDVIPIAFVDVFFGAGGLPELDLANICSTTSDPVFPGSALANCQFLAADIETCQAAGKVITISLGGAGGSVGFSTDAEGQAFADTVWNLFLGGTSDTRPFGSAVLDGVDLDIESGTGTGYAAFVNQLRTHFTGASKTFYVTGAPQCPYPDAALGSVINAAMFDAIYVQFYNNPCGLQNFDSASQWDYGIWDYWARYISPNPNVKIYIGAPASSSAAGGGYQPAASLANILQTTQKNFPSFGGAMMWDASQAYANDRYDVQIKSALTSAGTCDAAFTYPACSAPEYASGTGYAAGAQVSYQGYVWEAKWFASDPPASDPNSDWSAISACTGDGSSLPPPRTSITSSSAQASSTSSPVQTSTMSSQSPTVSVASTPTTTTTAAAATTTTSVGSCAGISAWSGQEVYTGGNKVTYNNHIWTAKWWTEADTPGGVAGVWTDDGTMSSCGGAGSQSSPTTTTVVASSTSSSAQSPDVQTTTTSSEEPTTSSTQSATTTASASSTTASSTSSTVQSSVASSPSATASNAGACAGVAAWNGQTAYTGNQQVTYNSHLWTAKWWSYADTPGGTAGVWADSGSCSSIAGRMLF